MHSFMCTHNFNKASSSGSAFPHAENAVNNLGDPQFRLHHRQITHIILFIQGVFLSILQLSIVVSEKDPDASQMTAVVKHPLKTSNNL